MLFRKFKDPHGGMVRPKLTNNFDDITKTMLYYQFQGFYSREIEMLKENGKFRGLFLQEYIRRNRERYTHKRLRNLTDMDFIQGINDVGLVEAYTPYDLTLFDAVIKKYKPKSVMDANANWGEKALYCHNKRIYYMGVELDDIYLKGYQDMLDDLQMARTEFYQAYMPRFSLMGNICDLAFIDPIPFDLKDVNYVNSHFGDEKYTSLDYFTWMCDVASRVGESKIKRLTVIVDENYSQSMDTNIHNFLGWHRESVIKESSLKPKLLYPNQRIFKIAMTYVR